jgi:hypothetical protein
MCAHRVCDVPGSCEDTGSVLLLVSADARQICDPQALDLMGRKLFRATDPLRDNTRQHEPYNLQSRTLWCAPCQDDADHGAYCCLERLWRTQISLSRFKLARPPTPRDTEASNAYAIIHDSLGPVCICSLIGINSYLQESAIRLSAASATYWNAYGPTDFFWRMQHHAQLYPYTMRCPRYPACTQ